MTDAVLVLNGTSALHEPTRRRMLDEWSRALGTTVRLETAGSVAALADALGTAPARGVVLELGDVDPDPTLQAAVASCAAPVVLVDLLGPGRPLPPARRHLADACDLAVVGRGIEGYRWALRYLRDRARRPATRVRYGDARPQWADLYVPDGPGPHPVAVVIHGGSWRGQWGADLMTGLAADLADHGVATLNLEFRLVHTDGGWPATFQDLAAAIGLVTELAADHELDPTRLGVVGHSSGGHLALWTAIGDVPGAPAVPPLRPAVVLSLAGVPDLHEGDRRATGEGDWAAKDFLGGHADEVPDRYAAASPAARLPLGVPLVLVQGLADRGDLVERAHAFAEQARAAGDDVTFLALPGVDHFHVIEADHPSWHAARDAVTSRLVPVPSG